jgi:hypothetical protein
MNTEALWRNSEKHKYLSEEDEMGGACSTNGGEEKGV